MTPPYALKGYVAVRRDKIGVVVMNALAKVFLTRRYRETLGRAIADGYYWRGHLRRREMGFVRCVEVDTAANESLATVRFANQSQNVIASKGDSR